MSKDYFALYESPNIVIVPTVISTTRKDSHSIDSSAAITDSSTNQQIDTEEPKTQSNLFVSDRHVPTSFGGNNSCVDNVDISKHFDNSKNLPLKTSTQHEVKVSHSKYLSHNNLVDLTTSSDLNTYKTTLKSMSSVNVDEIIDNWEDKQPTEIEEKEWGPDISRVQNNLMTETHSNTVTLNNMNPIMESNSTEKKLKYVSRHEKSTSGSTISQNPKKRSYHKSNTDNNRNQVDEKEIGLKQCKVLKTVSIRKKHETDQEAIHKKPENISKHNLNTTKSTSIAQKLHQKCEPESVNPNNEFLHTTLTDSQKNKLSAGALKRYLDYQRFLSKYYNKFDKNQCYEEKTTSKCNTIMDSINLKPKNEKNKTGSTVEQKHKDLKVNANIERIKNSNIESGISPNIERKPNKEESKRKSYQDKKESSEQSTNRNERKNKKEDYNEKSTKRMEKKEELKLKFASYCEARKKKSIESLYDKNIIETDKRFTQCSESRKKKRKHDGEIIDSSKQKIHKEKTYRKSYNSDIKKTKEETSGKVNKTKESVVKRKITSSNSATVVGSSQSNPNIESCTTPIRTVDVIEKSSCYNLQNSCKERNYLRSKLTCKSSKNQYNTESIRNKLTPTRENLIVTVKQDVPSTVPSSGNVQSVSKRELKKSKIKKNIHSLSKKEVVKKHKVKKSKTLKLVINIKCPNSDDSDGITSETSTSPHQDLSFLDDLDIDGIVDSLNAGQSPIRDCNKGVEKDLKRANNCDNNFNISTEPLEKDSSVAALQECDLLCIAEESKEGDVANANKSVLSATHTNEKIVEECNDDVYEVIDIVTDDSEHENVEESIVDITADASIIYINDNSRDDTEFLNELKDENKVAVTSESTENVQNVITEVDKQNEINITTIVDNEIELPKVKCSVALTASVETPASTGEAVEAKYSKKEFSKIEDSTIKSDKTFGNNCRIKSENLEESRSISTSDSNIREQMPNDANGTLKTIKNEKTVGIIVKTEDIDKSQKLLTSSSSIQEYVKTTMNIKTEVIENLEDPQNVATSDLNERKQIRNTGVNTTLKNIKKEQIAAIVKTEDVEKSQNDLTTSSNIQNHTAINTITESLTNLHTAVAIKSESSPVTVQPNIDLNNDDIDINLAKVMTTENVKITKESSSVIKISEDKSALIKSNSISSKYEKNLNEDSAEITANKNKSKDSDKLEAKNTKQQAIPGDAIIPKSILTTCSNIDHIYNGIDGNALNTIPEPISSTHSAITNKSECSSVPVQPNIDLKNDDINLAKVMMTTENVKINNESSSVMTISEDKAVLIKPNSISSKHDGNTNKHSAGIILANKNKPKNSDKFETTNTKKQVKPVDFIIPKSKNEKINPVTESVNLKNNIPNMYTDDNREKNIAKTLKMKILKKVKQTKSEVEVVTPVKSKTKANIANWSKIEQRMFEYLQRKFTITKKIHTGYFSSFYKCTDVNGGTYGIKVLKPRFQSMAIYKDKMLTNLQKSSDRDQYFLLEMINNFNIHGEWCFMSEYYPKTLAEFLTHGSKKKPKCFHIDVVQELSRQLVAAVCTLTHNQLIHSDIKPGHILLDSSHTRLKLCGFDRMDYNYNIKFLPSTGTVNYRAPEIIMGFDADYKIDVWSTALVMFEMAAGFKLFPGRFNNDILFKQISTLGPLAVDMIENSSHAIMYFYGTRFMKQIGPSDFIFVKFSYENHRIHNGPYASYQNTWARRRSHLQVTEDLDKIEMLHRLLQIMLVMDPRHRIPITYVAANEFIYHNKNNIPY